MSRMRGSVAFLAGALLLTTPAMAGAQCALCRGALSGSGNDDLIQGFYWSLALLTATPIALVATITFLVVRAYRKASADGIGSTSSALPIASKTPAGQ